MADAAENLACQPGSVAGIRRCLLSFLVLSPVAYAKQQCANDLYGQVFCAPKGGVLQNDAFGKFACSPGQCLQDDHGRLLCSAQKGGVVVRDPFKGIQCVGGCVQPHSKYCQKPG